MDANAILNAVWHRPTKPGAYWVTGYSLNDPKRSGLVSVIEKDGRLYANIHQENTSEDDCRWSLISDMFDKIVFAGPLELPVESAARGGGEAVALTFDAFRAANVARCVKWHPQGIASWSPSDWATAVMGELGELASLLKMCNRERDGLPGNKFSPTHKQIADELADTLTYLDLLAAVLGIDLGRAAAEKFNEVSERVGFPDRIEVA